MSFFNKIFSNSRHNLQEKIVELKTYIAKLEKENITYKKINLEQKLRILELEKKVELILIKKDSHNSSMSPASDIVKKNQSLRVKSNRKSGGQVGHKGHTLKFSDKPDKIVKLIPEFCNKCGSQLDIKKAILDSKRQLVDIPPVLPIYTEYQKYHIQCQCGNCQEVDYPVGVNSYIQYGPNVQAYIAYQSIYQYTPYKRLQDSLRHWYSLNISQGTIQNILSNMGRKALPIYYQIRSSLEKAESVGSDETGANVNGEKWWMWVWQNALMTFISLENSRGQKVIERLFPIGFPNAVIGTDRWAAQLNTEAKGHQLCMAHLLRDLIYLIEAEKSDTAKKLKELFTNAIKLKKAKSQYIRTDPIVKQVESKLNSILEKQFSTDDYPKTETFCKSMKKHRDSVFTFLYDKNVEPDNNASERAIRNVKIKQKISGQFKTGGDNFSILRSVIDTAIKAKADVKEVLKLVAMSENHYSPV